VSAFWNGCADDPENLLDLRQTIANVKVRPASEAAEAQRHIHP